MPNLEPDCGCIAAHLCTCTDDESVWEDDSFYDRTRNGEPGRWYGTINGAVWVPDRPKKKDGPSEDDYYFPYTI